jgi:2-succinyl-5-enolpyruvyl-6-hydroxy-3-cyclohexene-1-carboxylate synthase
MSDAPQTPLDFRNTNSLWGSVLVETLVHLGLKQVVISPGSRSSPLTIAFARHHAVEAIPVLDERSAAFFALGLARATKRPVALLCTSGTAGANYFPAVIEAQESGVPLLVITADRPPEMRDCGSGQTIDQQKLYGSHVDFYHEFAVPEATLPMLRYLRQTVAYAWERTQRPAGGPVHLNAPFRDPLSPVENGTADALQGKIDSKSFFSAQNPVAQFPLDMPAPTLRLGGRGIIIAGPVQPTGLDKYVRAVGRIARTLGWPVLADALSPLRNHTRSVPNMVTSYDLIARSTELRKELRPTHVLVLHGWPTSKSLRQWIDQSDAEITLMTKKLQNPDALHGRTRLIACTAEALAGRVKAGARPRGWLAQWLAVNKSLNRRLVRSLGAIDWPFEGKASTLLPGLLPKGTPVFVANSMPVRDVEYFWPVGDRGHGIYFNRGANGIDGTLSTALGIAHGSGRPAVLLTGDLALLHDTNGFLTLPKFTGSLTVMLINNNGGGIFEHLPVAKFEPPFEEFFATPQEVDFSKLCATYGVAHVLVKDWKHFSGLLAKLPRRGVRVLELRTDRKRDARFRQELFARLSSH